MLPWKRYEEGWCQAQVANHGERVVVVVYDRADPRFVTWTASVNQYHPAPERLTQGARALHARNYGILLQGEAVVALPSTRPGGGGTGQGMRIARALGLDLLDLSQIADRDRAHQLLEKS